MPRVLVVEDERKLLRSLQRGLEANGYEVITAASGAEAKAQFNALRFECLVLDWMLPNGDGLDVLAELRRTGDRTPVLMLTARDAVEDRVVGLDNGADDYLVKPFAFAELLARLRSLLRRGQSDRDTVLRAGDLEIDLLERKAVRAGTVLSLRSREFDLLAYLMRHRDATVTRDMLGRDVWNEPAHALTNVIDVTVTLLRKKLNRPGRAPLIHTIMRTRPLPVNHESNAISTPSSKYTRTLLARIPARPKTNPSAAVAETLSYQPAASCCGSHRRANRSQ